MWMHKTIDEVSAEENKSRTSFRIPAFWGIMAFACALVRSSGYITFRSIAFPPRNSDLYHAFLHALILAGLTFAIVYLCQRFLGWNMFPRANDRKTVICNRCFRVKSADDQESCKCGGKFEDFKLWKWVDD